MSVQGAALIGGVADVIGGAGAVGEHQHVGDRVAAQECGEEVGLIGGDAGERCGQGGGPVLVAAGA